jgi:signal transduction histidine kinase
MRLGLRGRIALLVLVALAPPTIVAVVTELRERSEARDRAKQDVLGAARLVRADVARVVSGTAGFVAPLSRDLARHPDRRSCERLLGLVPRSSTRFASIGVARADGTVYCGATQRGLLERGHGTTVGAGSWFGAAQRSAGFVLTEYRKDPLSGMGALLGAQALPGPPGEPRRVMFVAIDIRTLGAATAVRDAPPNTEFVLFDDHGTLLAQSRGAPGTVGRSVVDRPLLERVLRQHQGTAEVKDIDGVERIHGFAPVGGPAADRLFVSAGRASAEVFADPNEDLKRFGVLGVLGVGLALLLAYLANKLLLERWTSAVVESARRFGAGDLTARAPRPHGFGELNEVSNALNSAAQEIERRQREQAQLMAELVAVEEETRRRIAADIHDDTAQAVAAAGLRLDGLIAELTDPEARDAAQKTREALREANRRLRRLLFELRPPALDRAGLAPALELFLADAFESNGFDWRVQSALESEPSPEARAVLYRVALEALTNVRKHAHASTVDVMLERRGEGVAVRVRDDGDGFELSDPAAGPEAGHIGLLSMRERAEAAGGRFSLESAPGEGTVVDFWMPEPNGRPGRPS